MIPMTTSGVGRRIVRLRLDPLAYPSTLPLSLPTLVPRQRPVVCTSLFSHLGLSTQRRESRRIPLTTLLIIHSPLRPLLERHHLETFMFLANHLGGMLLHHPRQLEEHRTGVSPSHFDRFTMSHLSHRDSSLLLYRSAHSPGHRAWRPC